MYMALAVGLAAWLVATLASVWAVRRWHLQLWDPIQIAALLLGR